MRWKVALFALVALLLVGEQVVFFSGGAAGTTGAPAARPLQATLSGTIQALAGGALGRSDRGVRRFWLTDLRADPRHPALRMVRLTWAINGDLSMGSVSAGAQIEVLLLLKALYTAQLPISMVRLTGTFGEHGPDGRGVEVPVLEVGLDGATAQLIDWETMDATSLWPLLHRYMVRQGFECQCQE